MVETKFLIENPAQVSPILESLGLSESEIESADAIEIVDRYLDTTDWQVLRSGWACRSRDMAGEQTVCLNSVGANGETLCMPEEGQQPLVCFPENGKHLSLVQVARRLRGIHQEELQTQFEVQNHRRRYCVRTGEDALIELAMDHIAITVPAPHQKLAPEPLRFDELELELKEGAEESLQKLAETLQSQFSLLPSRLSKFERGLQTAGRSPGPTQIGKQACLLEQTGSARKLHSGKLNVHAPVVKLAHRHLLEQFEIVLHQEPRAWEGLDPEGVHQMRVATRRIRAALGAFKKVVPSASRKHFRGEFKWVAAALGDVRDLDVYLGNFQQYTTELPTHETLFLMEYRNHLEDQWRQARQRLLDCLRSQRYQALSADFIKFLSDGPSTFSPSDRSRTIGKAARQTIGKQLAQVLRNGRAIQPDSPDDALHALRIDCKRLRYLFEFFQPIFGKKLRKFIKRLKELQDVLGDFQDARVATQQLRAYAERVPMRVENRGQLLALGQLVHNQRCQAAAQRNRFSNVWARFVAKVTREKVIGSL